MAQDVAIAAEELALPAPRLAPRLIGCELEAFGVRARIAETEAYQGEEDLACHASRGRTARTDVLYRAPGTVYLYLCYGIHVLLNLVCDQVDRPAAVLIRGVLVRDGEDLARRRRRAASRLPLAQLANGPGKVTQALGLALAHNGTVLGSPDCPLRLYAGATRPALSRGPRVGVDYAGPLWAAKPWRWWQRGFPAARA